MLTTQRYIPTSARYVVNSTEKMGVFLLSSSFVPPGSLEIALHIELPKSRGAASPRLCDGCVPLFPPT